VGTFQPNAGASSCTLASIGSYVSTTGAAAQTPCPAGKTTASTGSTSLASCTAQALTSSVIDQIQLASVGASAKDAGKLQQAVKQLNAALDPALWTNGAPDAKRGDQVFQDHKAAVQILAALMKDKKSTIPDATIQGWIDAIVAADRSLALDAINAAVLAGGDAKKVADANKELAKGDAEGADGKSTQAIDHYLNAWKKAVDAVK